MSLRQQLLDRAQVRSATGQNVEKLRVAFPSARNCATFPQSAQHPAQHLRNQDPAPIGKTGQNSATGNATTEQLPSCARGEKHPLKVAQSCAVVAPSCAPGQDPFYDRNTCTACRHLWPGKRCLNHHRAGLTTRDLAPEFTHLAQRCPGFAPMERPPPTPQTETDRAQTEADTDQPIFLKDTIMSLTVSEGAAGSYTPPEAGTFAARCVKLIDLGTQVSTFEGEAKSAHKLLIGFEITDSDNRRDDGTPHIVSKRFTASLHPKAALRKFLEAWRGKPFTPAELAAFDLKVLLGQPCLLGIVHDSKADRTYANLSSCMKLPKGFTAGAGTEPLVHFDVSEPDWTVFAALGSRLQDQIAASPEYARLTPPKTVSLAPQAPTSAPQRPPAPPTPAPAKPAPVAAAGSGFDDMDDDIPF